MTSHLCNRNSRWADNTVVECGCAASRATLSSQLNRTGYQKKTRIRNSSVDESPPGSPIVRHKDHFDGTIDAKVYPKPVRMRRSELV